MLPPPANERFPDPSSGKPMGSRGLAVFEPSELLTTDNVKIQRDRIDGIQDSTTSWVSEQRLTARPQTNDEPVRAEKSQTKTMSEKINRKEEIKPLMYERQLTVQQKIPEESAHPEERALPHLVRQHQILDEIAGYRKQPPDELWMQEDEEYEAKELARLNSSRKLSSLSCSSLSSGTQSVLQLWSRSRSPTRPAQSPRSLPSSPVHGIPMVPRHSTHIRPTQELAKAEGADLLVQFHGYFEDSTERMKESGENGNCEVNIVDSLNLQPGSSCSGTVPIVFNQSIQTTSRSFSDFTDLSLPHERKDGDQNLKKMTTFEDGISESCARSKRMRRIDGAMPTTEIESLANSGPSGSIILHDLKECSNPKEALQKSHIENAELKEKIKDAMRSIEKLRKCGEMKDRELIRMKKKTLNTDTKIRELQRTVKNKSRDIAEAYKDQRSAMSLLITKNLEYEALEKAFAQSQVDLNDCNKKRGCLALRRITWCVDAIIKALGAEFLLENEENLVRQTDDGTITNVWDIMVIRYDIAVRHLIANRMAFGLVKDDDLYATNVADELIQYANVHTRSILIPRANARKGYVEWLARRYDSAQECFHRAIENFCQLGNDEKIWTLAHQANVIDGDAIKGVATNREQYMIASKQRARTAWSTRIKSMSSSGSHSDDGDGKLSAKDDDNDILKSNKTITIQPACRGSVKRFGQRVGVVPESRPGFLVRLGNWFVGTDNIPPEP